MQPRHMTRPPLIPFLATYVKLDPLSTWSGDRSAPRNRAFEGEAGPSQFIAFRRMGGGFFDIVAGVQE